MRGAILEPFARVTNQPENGSLPLPRVDTCYFCDIIAGRSDAWNVVERNELTVTMLNGRQFAIGQCMVVPIRHAPTLLDLTGEEGAAVMAAAQRLMRVLIGELAPDGVLLYQNNGVGSLQEVPHYHLHVVPHVPGSEWGSGPPHLAAVQSGRRPPHLDHAIVTDAKRETVGRLRNRFTSDDPTYDGGGKE